MSKWQMIKCFFGFHTPEVVGYPCTTNTEGWLRYVECEYCGVYLREHTEDEHK